MNLHILRGGCGTRHPLSFVMSRPEGLKNYLLLIIRSSSHFTINGVDYAVGEGSALIVAPNTPYSYHNPHGYYADDWLHFSLDQPINQVLSIGQMNIPFPIGDHSIYTTYIQQILWESMYSNGPDTAINTESLFRVLMNNLRYAYDNREHLSASHSHYERLQHLRLHVQNTITEPHSVQEAADFIGISPSYFQALYKQYFNIAFQSDVIHMRIEYAKYMIATTNLSMEMVAEVCGYSNHVHFYRQFKKITGITPAKYRQSDLG